MPLLTRLAWAAACLLLLAGWASASAARASDTQTSIMVDDPALLEQGDQVRDDTLARMQQLGVDVVRVTVVWGDVAGTARTGAAQRRRFEPTRPGTYPATVWDRYDRLVRRAESLGLRVYLTLTPPAPVWARPRAPRALREQVRRAWRPDPVGFAAFVEAVGRRYSGRYRDENDGRERLPRVETWSLVNEPNQAGWLAPQWEDGRMASPALARELILRGRAALDRTGHGRDTILFGETAPLGSSRRRTTSAIRPKRWLRELACERASAPGCNLFDKFGPIRATAYAHHPTTKNRAPTERDPARDSITTANIDHLPVLLDRLAARTRHLPRELPVQLTAFGYETNPPDPFSGVPLARQAEWLQTAELIAFRHPRVAAHAQSLLRDLPPVETAVRGTRPFWFTFQTGLEFADGAPKPALTAYVFPFLASSAGPGEADVWGQLRFRPNDLPPGAQDVVGIQHSLDGRTWRDLETIPVTNARGFFTARVPVPPGGLLRATYPGTAITSLPDEP